MSRFRFPLQPLLDHKYSVEATLRAQAMRCKAAVVAAHEGLNALHEQLRAGDRAQDLRARAMRQHFVTDSIHRQNRIVTDCEAALASAHLRLRDAAKETMALERLKQRRFEAHIEARERSEEAELDESNTRRNRMQ